MTGPKSHPVKSELKLLILSFVLQSFLMHLPAPSCAFVMGMLQYVDLLRGNFTTS